MTISNTFTVRITAPASGPEWFTQRAANTWYQVATGVGGADWSAGVRLDQSVPNLTLSYDDLCMNNNGATVAPDYGEFIIALNGGHAGNSANDAYALALNVAQPYWYQVVERTPVAYTDLRVNNQTTGAVNPLGTDGNYDVIIDNQGYALAPPYYVPCVLEDGIIPWTRDANNFVLPANVNHAACTARPRSLHTNNNTHYHNGKVWWPFMNAPGVSGRSHGHKCSLNFAGIKANPGLKTFVAGQLAPWAYHGPITEWPSTSLFTGNGDFGTAALDRTTGRIWYRGQSWVGYWAMETVGASAGQHTYYTNGDSARALISNGATICYLPKVGGGLHTLWVMMEGSTTGSYYVKVCDVTGAGLGSPTVPTWTRHIPTNATQYEWAWGLKSSGTNPTIAGYSMGWGMVWHEPSQAILAYNCDQIQKYPLTPTDAQNRNVIRKLSPPMSNGYYAPTGAWTWSEVTLAGDAPETLMPSKGLAGGGASSHSRFNLIPNFDGAGNALLIHQSRYNTPTRVAKLGAV